MDPVGAGTTTPRRRTPTRSSMTWWLLAPGHARIGDRGEPTADPAVEIPGNDRHNLDNHTLICDRIDPILCCPRIRSIEERT